MADLSYTVDVNTTPAQRNLAQLQTRIQTVNNSFNGLRSAIAGLAIGAAITNVIRLADSIQDVSDATGIAVQNILGFQQAVQLNGGTAEQAQSSITKLVQTIGEAADGGKNAQSAFKDVGVTLEDLRTLSEQDILSKTIKGIAKVDDAGKRLTLTTELLGKGFRGVNVAGVATQLDSATAASIRHAKAVQQTAEMQNKLDIATQKLQLSLLKAIQPLVEFINKMDDDKIGAMIESIVKLSAAIAALAASIYVIEKLAKGFAYLAATFGTFYALFKVGTTQIAAGIALIGTKMLTIGNIFKNIGQLILIPINSLAGLLTRLGTIFQAVIGSATMLRIGLIGIGIGLVRLVPYIAAVAFGIYLLNEALKALTNKGILDWWDEFALKLEKFISDKFPRLAAAINKLNDMLGMGPLPSVAAANKAEHENEMARLKNRMDALKQGNKVEGDRRKVIDQNAQELAKFQLMLKQQNESTYIGLQHARDRIYTESQLINLQSGSNRLSDDEIEIIRAQNDASDEKLQKIIAIRQEIEKLQLEMKTGSKDETLPGRIKMLQQQSQEIESMYNKHIELLPEYIRKLQTAKILEEDRLRTAQNMAAAIEAQIQRQQTLGDLLIQANDKAREVQFGGEQQKRSPLQQQMAAIQEDARKAALEAGRTFSASFEGMDLTAEQAQELADGLQLIAERYKAIADEQTRQLEYSRSWEAGWKDAFDKYMDNATNAANRAGEVFGSITRNMESAIDRFVETGKFSFKDFARSIIQDLLKIELKSQAMKIFGAIGGSGGIISAIGSLLGFANGGDPPVNKPSIVGEKGPELFVPKTAGTIIPNHALQGGGGGAINAPVTNNYITNNISALDARSVAQLFAENRKTLLGSVEMARKELPYATR